jgi:hypothetical protein
MILRNGEGHQLLKGQIAIAIDLHQFRGDRTQAQALPNHVRRHAEPGSNLLRAETAFVRELLECLELIGGMKRLGYASTVLLAVWR